MKAYIVRGLPGSGKTEFAKRYLNVSEDCVFDDADVTAIGRIQKAVQMQKDIAIVDARTLTLAQRASIEYMVSKHCLSIDEQDAMEFVFIAFENNPKQCEQNNVGRANKENVNHSIRLFSKIYETDNRDIVLKVYGS